MLAKKMSNLTQLLQKVGISVGLDALAQSVQQSIDGASVYITNRDGKIIGQALTNGLESNAFDNEWINADAISSDLRTTINRIAATSTIDGNDGERFLVSPIIGADERVGTFLVVLETGDFDTDDEILTEFASTVCGMIISQAITEKQEGEVQEVRAARLAFSSLSYSEVRAIQRILEELDGDEGLLVASRIADEAEITRSVIVNALRKLASANVIESRSLGMKGTYLRILNKEIRKEFEKQWYPHPKTQ